MFVTLKTPEILIHYYLYSILGIIRMVYNFNITLGFKSLFNLQMKSSDITRNLTNTIPTI